MPRIFGEKEINWVLAFLSMEETEMKYVRSKILLGVLASVLALGCVLAVMQSDAVAQAQGAQAQWKVVTPTTNFGDKWRMAAFRDGSFGLTGGAGDQGKARYTSDGGKNWAQADSSGG
jgi:hypothetical protein